MVQGEGPRPAERMIIGEAPGHTEVAEGRPFVGLSGALLNTALAELGIERDSVYVTNVVKEIPLDAGDRIRPPTFEEQSDGWTILKEEIYEVNPDKILCLGKTAGNWFGLSDDVIKAWHPGYVLRRGGYGSPTYAEWIEQMRPFADG